MEMRAASEVDHLFPTAWLHASRIRDRCSANQVANLADVDLGYEKYRDQRARARRIMFCVCALKARY